jgi:hypothetical protein
VDSRVVEVGTVAKVVRDELLPAPENDAELACVVVSVPWVIDSTCNTNGVALGVPRRRMASPEMSRPVTPRVPVRFRNRGVSTSPLGEVMSRNMPVVGLFSTAVPDWVSSRPYANGSASRVIVISLLIGSKSTESGPDR